MTISDADKNEYIRARLEQSAEAAADAKMCLDNNRLSLAVNRIYYSVFYMISALAIKNGFSTSKHRQLLGWFNKNYISSGVLPASFGKLIYKAYEQREKSDYDFLYTFTREEVISMYDELTEFNKSLKTLIMS